MSEPTSNDKWNKLLADADAGAIDARVAIVGAREHYDTVYGSNFKAVIAMLETMDEGIGKLQLGVDDARVAAKEARTSADEAREKAVVAAAKGTMIFEYMSRTESKIDLFTLQLAEMRGELTERGTLLDQIRIDVAALTALTAHLPEWQEKVEARLDTFEKTRTESKTHRQKIEREQRAFHVESKKDRAELRTQIVALTARFDTLTQQFTDFQSTWQELLPPEEVPAWLERVRQLEQDRDAIQVRLGMTGNGE